VRVPSRLEEFAPRQCKSRVEKRRRPTFAGNLTGRARWVAVPLSRDAFDGGETFIGRKVARLGLED